MFSRVKKFGYDNSQSKLQEAVSRKGEAPGLKQRKAIKMF